MSRVVIKTLTSPDGQRRVEINRRDDGLFDFIELKRYESGSLSSPDGSFWTPSGSWGTITDTVEAAEREARGRVTWLSDCEI